MALVLADRVKETTTTAGTGTIDLAGAVSGFRTFVAGVGNGNTTYYTIVDGTAWEVGTGVVTDATPDTLSRVLLASSTGSLLSLSGGACDVFCTIPGSSYAPANSVVDFRLTLTTGVAVTTEDVTAAGTLYCTPYKGKYIDLYDGAAWNRRSSAEFSLALTLTSGKPYDVFVYDNAGTPTLEVLVWTNDTTRATALALQDGVLVKSGATTRRYLGTFYTTSTTTTEDSAAKRYLWNYYNRVARTMVADTETADTWTYDTTSYRQANANTANQLNYVQGVAEDCVKANVVSQASITSIAGAYAGIGVDSTTVNSSQQTGSNIIPNSGGGYYQSQYSFYRGCPGAGRHYLAWLERAVTSTTTWVGDNGDAGGVRQMGISGEIMA